MANFNQADPRWPVFKEWMKVQSVLLFPRNTDEVRVVNPSAFVYTFQMYCQTKNIDMFGQNDVNECMHILLDIFHHVNPMKKTELVGQRREDLSWIDVQCQQFWNQQKEYSAISHFVEGLAFTSIRPHSTREIVSVHPEPFTILHIPVSGATFDDCMHAWRTPEPVEGWLNERTQCRETMEKQNHVYRWPTVLFVALDRVTTSYQKQFISIPLQWTPTGDAIHPYPKSYELIGTCNYTGDVSSGHYVVCLKEQQTQQWKLVNDELLFPCAEMNVVTSGTCLVMFLEREFHKLKSDA
jgi:ubiquitin C-terminal hydrolase